MEFDDKRDDLRNTREVNNLKKQRKRSRLGIKITIVVCVLAVVSVSVYGWYLYNNQNYSSYETKVMAERSDGTSTRYLTYNRGQVLKYSRDGAMAMDGDGNILWNGSYEFANPMAAVCNEYAVIADIGGMQACIYNGTDSGTMLEVYYPIEQAVIAGQGVVALLLKEETSDVIQIYNPYDSTNNGLLAEIPTNVQNDGFPTDIAISEDGTKLVTSMIKITGGAQENYVNFYNFSEVGENNLNRLVGARSFKEVTVADVAFLDNDTVFVSTENGFSLYSMKQLPNDVLDKTFKKDIRSLFTSDSYVGVILDNYSDKASYLLNVYSTDGSLVYERKINFEYSGAFLSGKEIVLHDSMNLEIYRLNGKQKYKGSFENGIADIMPVNNFETYIVMNQSTIYQIKLK